MNHFIKLTTEDGKPMFIRPDFVSYVTSFPTGIGEDENGYFFRTFVCSKSGTSEIVKETVESVVGLIEEWYEKNE